MATHRVKASRVDALRAMRAGRVAAEKRRPVTSCPYSPTGNLAERMLNRMWIRGFTLHADPPPAAAQDVQPAT